MESEVSIKCRQCAMQLVHLWPNLAESSFMFSAASVVLNRSILPLFGKYSLMTDLTNFWRLSAVWLSMGCIASVKTLNF